MSNLTADIFDDINDELADDVCKVLASAKWSDTVLLRVDSSGGYCCSMFKILKGIHKSKAKTVNTVCLGRAHSAAGVIFLQGNNRKMCPGSEVMIHCAHVQ